MASGPQQEIVSGTLLARTEGAWGVDTEEREVGQLLIF